MNSVEKEVVLHCLKSMIDEELCEECSLYGTTGTDHCEKDCVRLAINELEQDTKTEERGQIMAGTFEDIYEVIKTQKKIIEVQDTMLVTKEEIIANLNAIIANDEKIIEGLKNIIKLLEVKVKVAETK